MRTAHYLRLAALLGVGATALHQLLGHGYLTELLPALAVLTLSAAVATLIRGTEGASPSRAPLSRRVFAFTVVLFVVSGGGWLALPLALAIGALTALAAHALEGVEHAIAVTHAERRRRSRPPAVRGRPLPARMARISSTPLAFGLARRPPPPAPA